MLALENVCAVSALDSDAAAKMNALTAKENRSDRRADAAGKVVPSSFKNAKSSPSNICFDRAYVLQAAMDAAERRAAERLAVP